MKKENSAYRFIGTLYNILLRIARNFLETRKNFKILIHPFHHTNLDQFSWEWSKKNIFFEEKKKIKMADFSKWPIFQNGRFSKSPILKIFLRKFHRSVLGFVQLIDAKPINVAQPMWSWGCLTYGQKQAKNAFFVFLGCFCPYVRQPQDHIGWLTLMALVSINPTL